MSALSVAQGCKSVLVKLKYWTRATQQRKRHLTKNCQHNRFLAVGSRFWWNKLHLITIKKEEKIRAIITYRLLRGPRQTIKLV